MATQFNAETFLLTLTCPFGLDPLREAVTLLPCCHKVNQIAAERCYGEIVNGSCKLGEKPCIVCRTPVVTWFPDPLVRSLASQVFGHDKDLGPLPTHSLILEDLEEKRARVNLPYPGISAVFEYRRGSWKPHNNIRNALRRELCFRSTTAGSLLKKFELCGYQDGEVLMVVYFKKNDFFKDYLLAYGLLCQQNLGWSVRARNPADLRALFGIIASNNTIPAEYLEQIRAIVT